MKDTTIKPKAQEAQIVEVREPVPQLQQMVDEETRNRQILTAYITNHMKKGIDYAPIHINKTCQDKYNCTNKYHFSKDNLTKAGAEKIGSLLALRPETVMDRDTWEMAGSRPGLYCYKCNLYNLKTGALIGDGLGACDKKEKSESDNTAIKIAKKRAFVDAVLSVGKLSDFFTQDLDEGLPSLPAEHTSNTPQNASQTVSKSTTDRVLNSCPQCKEGTLKEERKKDGTPYLKCSLSKWNNETKRNDGCNYVKWGKKIEPQQTTIAEGIPMPEEE